MLAQDGIRRYRSTSSLNRVVDSQNNTKRLAALRPVACNYKAAGLISQAPVDTTRILASPFVVVVQIGDGVAMRVKAKLWHQVATPRAAQIAFRIAGPRAQVVRAVTLECRNILGHSARLGIVGSKAQRRQDSVDSRLRTSSGEAF